MFHRIIFMLGLLLVWGSCTQHTKPDYATDIAPLIAKNCGPCHHENGPAPFALLTYEQVSSKAKLIAYVTEKRIMPPWPADPEYTHFANETYLKQDEINLIQQWVKEGLAPGDTQDMATPAQRPQHWDHGKPDLIVKMPKPILVPGTNTDRFLVVKIPFELPQDTFIRAIEFVPGSKRLVHHMNAHIIRFDPLKKKELMQGPYYVDQDQTKSQTIHRELNLLQDDGSYAPMTPSVCNYLPGSQFSFYPDEVGGYALGKKNAFYLNDLHYGPSAIEAWDSSYFKIYYAAAPPKRPVAEFQIGTLGLAPVEPALVVPPGVEKTFHIRFPVTEDISILTLVPHMHLIGKSFWAYAIKPSGDTIRLIRIPRWDFRWQYFYQPPQMLKLPRGSVLYVEGVFDNTANNPNNPFSPPREIGEREGSMKTTDEMFQLIITYVPWKEGDEAISMTKER